MKYTMTELDNALDTLLPTIKKAKSKGISFTRPDLCNMVAVQFMVSGDYEDRRDYEKQCCYSVVQDALVSLHEVGYFDFKEETV